MKRLRVALIDYRTGNLHSLGKALERAGASVTATVSWTDALAHDALVLPGVGAFGQASATLPEDRGPLLASLADGMPCLGICLGMQLYFEGSAESPGEGIGFMEGRIERLRTATVPQMGWNAVETGDDPVFSDVGDLVAYYANSYVCEPARGDVAIGWSEHDGQRFTAAVRRANAWGFQFHPEKSSLPGLQLLANWVRAAEKVVRGGDS